MKKTYSLLLILTIAAGSLFAQSFQLQTSTGQVIPNGGTVGLKRTLYDTTVDVYTDLIIKNVSASSLKMVAVKTPRILADTQKAYFCLGIYCFDDTATVSPEFPISSGATSDLAAHLRPKGCKGSAVVYYKVFNTANPNDSVSVYVQYEIWNLGIDEQSGTGQELGKAFPNPASESFTVNYTVSNQEDTRLVLRNILGITVREAVLSAVTGAIKLNVSDLPEGIYFYSLNSNGKSVSTRKLLIRH